MQQLTAQDAQFLYMEDADIVANITGAYVFDQSTAPGGLVRFKDIVGTIEKRLENCPFFRRKLMRVPMELDFPYWVDDPHFDIEYHVHHARLPKPSDWRQFCILLARYHSRPLDMGRPPWEVYVVEGLDDVAGVPKGSFALIAKVHHCAVDGASGLQLLGALTDLSPDGPPAFRYPRLPRFSGDAPTPPAVLARAAFNSARSPLQLARAVGRASPQIAQAFANAQRSRASQSGPGVPSTPFNAPVSPHKAFDAALFDLADFKTIRAAYQEAKINDIVLATVSGGVRRYLAAKNKLPKESLIAMAPINLRATDGTNKQGVGNRISAMTMPLHTHAAHPVERLKAIVLSTRRSKAAKDGLGARLMTDLTQHAPASILALASRFVAQGLASGQPMSNLIVSNVPGPQTPLYFCGAKMTSMHGMAPLGDGMGLFIATPSYDGKIAFCVTSTREIIPDTPFFTDCLRESFAELKTAAERRLASPPTDSGKHKKKKKRKTDEAQRKSNGAADSPAWT